jgi:hypothetical protein
VKERVFAFLTLLVLVSSSAFAAFYTAIVTDTQVSAYQNSYASFRVRVHGEEGTYQVYTDSRLYAHPTPTSFTLESGADREFVDISVFTGEAAPGSYPVYVYVQKEGSTRALTGTVWVWELEEKDYYDYYDYDYEEPAAEGQRVTVVRKQLYTNYGIGRYDKSGKQGYLITYELRNNLDRDLDGVSVQVNDAPGSWRVMVRGPFELRKGERRVVEILILPTDMSEETTVTVSVYEGNYVLKGEMVELGPGKVAGGGAVTGLMFLPGGMFELGLISLIIMAAMFMGYKFLTVSGLMERKAPPELVKTGG